MGNSVIYYSAHLFPVTLRQLQIVYSVLHNKAPQQFCVKKTFTYLAASIHTLCFV